MPNNVSLSDCEITGEKNFLPKANKNEVLNIYFAGIRFRFTFYLVNTRKDDIMRHKKLVHIRFANQLQII